MATTTTTSVLATIPEFHDTVAETYFTYERTDGKRVDMTVGHHTVHNNWKGKRVEIFPALLIGVMRKDDPNCKALESVDLSIEEARILRDLLNKPEVQHILEKY